MSDPARAQWARFSSLRGSSFEQPPSPAPRLIAILIRLAHHAGLRTFVVDPRDRFNPAARLPDAEQLVVDWPQEGLARAGGLEPSTAVIALTPAGGV